MRLVCLLLLASACRTLSPELTTQDADGDGVLAADDCDDSNELVFPGATESCNGVDDDCNGTIDDVAEGEGTALYIDSDQDGYGQGEPIYACDAFDGVVDLPGDCDDTDDSIFPGAPEPDCTDPVDRDCDGLPAAVDADDDGVPACNDCNDDDPDVFPGATERCNGIDDDCNDLIDDDAVDAAAWFLDGDNDGFGDATQSTASCDAPDGYVGSDDDCNDDDPSIRPGADETCDGVDQDCDGGVDEAAIDAPLWYADSDNDGYGGPLFVRECAQPDGFVADTTDCNDLNALAFPGAPETCNGADDDCDDVVDNNPVDPSTWFADPDGDTWGDAATGTTLACTVPEGFAARSGDCAEGDSAVNPDASELCNGVDDDCDQSTDEDAVDAPSWYADVDDDGYGGERLVVAACEQPDGFLADAEDCDDLDDDISPEAFDICGDGIDQDCDGQDRTGIDGGSPECAAISCAAILDTNPDSPDGAYWIDATGSDPVQTWCDQAGGGWTLGFVKNSADLTDYGDFGSGYVRTDNLTLDPAAASASPSGIAGWLDLNEASWTELRIHSYRDGSESYRSDIIDRASLRIDFGQDGYFLYGEHGYYWCGGVREYTDFGRGQVNRPPGAPADCKGHGSVGDGWDFSQLDRTNRGLTLCGTNASRWMNDAFAGTRVFYPDAGAAQALWVR